VLSAIADALPSSAFHHVGVLVEDFAEAHRVLALLGFACGDPFVEPELGVECLWCSIGGVDVELLRPIDDRSRVAKLLREGHGGVHHIALAVADVGRALEQAREAGVHLRDEQPRRGVHGSRIAFLDPGSLDGMLVELVEEPR
jgi:methylmalonyl-CoA epimerase